MTIRGCGRPAINACFAIFVLSFILSQTACAVALGASPWPMWQGNPQHTGQSLFRGPSSPNVKWTFETDSPGDTSPAIASDGTIYATTWKGTLYAVNPDGSKKWVFHTGGGMQGLSPAIGPDGTVYLGSDGDKLYAIDPNGAEKWAVPMNYGVDASPVVGSDGMVYVDSRDRHLYAINPGGVIKWTFFIGPGLHSSPAIGKDGTVYQVSGGSGGRLYAINPNGTKKWTFPADARWGRQSAPTVQSMLWSDDHGLYAVNPDGTEKWAFRTRDSRAVSPAIGSDGTVYVCSEYILYAVNPDGSQKWAGPMQGELTSPVIGADGTVYEGGTSYNLCAVNADGSQKWVFPAGGWVSSPAVGADGTLYVGSANGPESPAGKLRAIGPGPSPKTMGSAP